MEQQNPDATEEYVPGVAEGRHYMAKLCYFSDGLWSVDVIHLEGLPPLSGDDTRWPTRAEAVHAVNQRVAALAH